jgi:hypothetical protein
MSYDYLVEYEGEHFEVEIVSYQPERPAPNVGRNHPGFGDPGEGEEVEFRINNVDEDTELDLQNDSEFCSLVIEHIKLEQP